MHSKAATSTIATIAALLLLTGVSQAAPARLHASASIPFPYAGTSYAALGAGAGSLWVFVPSLETVYRYAAPTGRLVAQIPVASKPTPAVLANSPEGRLVVTGGFVWVADQASRSIYRISPGSNRVVATVRMRDPYDIASDGHAIWVPEFSAYRVTRIDSTTNTVASSIPATGPTSVALGDGSLWVVSHRADRVLRVDPRTGVTRATIALRRGSGPEVARFYDAALWVSTPGDNTLTRIDARTNKPTEIPLPDGAEGGLLATGGGAVWIENFRHVYRVDPRTSSITGAFTVSHPGRCGVGPFISFPCTATIAYANGVLWVLDPAGERILRVAA
jgi:streptogramin lyase